MSGLVNAFPRESRLLWDLATSGKYDEAVRVYRWFTPLLHLDTHPKLVQFIKGRSSGKLQEEFPELRKRYWGQHLWARGYFCASVGAVDDQTAKQYIENQKWDEDDQGFKITAPAEP